MKRIALFVGLILPSFVLALTAGEIPVVSPAQAGLSEPNLAKVDQFMEKAVANQQIAGGVVIVSHDGKIGFLHTYGLHGSRRAKADVAGHDFSDLFHEQGDYHRRRVDPL